MNSGHWVTMIVTRTLVLTLTLLSVVSPTMASPSYPDEIRALLDLSYVPDCTLCHSAGSKGGAVDTPFGRSMVKRGLRGAVSNAGDSGVVADAGSIDPTLRQALEAMRVDRVDSDGDREEDLDELAWHSDPNTYDGLRPNSTPSVSYGCHISYGSGATGGASLVMLAIACALFRRKTPGIG